MKLTDKQRKAMFAKKTEWGFDLTDFEPDGFQKVLKGLKIPLGNVSEDFGRDIDNAPYRRGWKWHGEGIEIITGNNPITGEYRQTTQRSPEKDYASYIGIEGERAKVLLAVKLIKETSGNKDESPERRDFI